MKEDDQIMKKNVDYYNLFLYNEFNSTRELIEIED